MLLAFGLAVTGYVLAFRSPEPAFGSDETFSIEFGEVEREDTTAPGPLSLTYQPGPARTLQLKFEQADTSGRHDISTRIDAEVYEERKEPAEGSSGVRFERTYERVGVSIGENSKPVGETISDQIESMIDSAEEVIEVDAIGKPREYSWESVSNPQVRQTLRILRHATVMLHPRPRRGELNVGDTWSYRLPASLMKSDHVSEIDGAVRIEEKLADTVERGKRTLAVIERSFEVDAKGKVYLPDPEKTYEFTLSGEGSGTAHLDPSGGTLVESRLRIERRLHIPRAGTSGEERSGRIHLILREKPTPAEG